jgi:hypothetical protein
MTDDELQLLREFRAEIPAPDEETRRRVYAYATCEPRRALRGRRWRLPSLAVAAAVVAAAVAILPISPWNGDGGLVQRALAAVGTGEVLHVVFTEQPGPPGWYQGVSLPSGTPLPDPTLREEIWYDQSRGLKNTVTSLPSGDVLYEYVQTPQADYNSAGQITNAITMKNGKATPGSVGPAAALEPALAGFVDDYQSALASGQAKQTGTGQVDGHDVIWLHIAADPAHYYPAMDVAIDASTYAPVQVRTDNTDPVQLDVSEIDTQPYDPSLFASPPVHYQPVSSTTGAMTPIDATQAPGILGGQAVWLGRTWNGYQLVDVEQEQLTDDYAPESGKQPVQSVGVIFTYAPPGGSADSPDVLRIRESALCEIGLGMICGGVHVPREGVLFLHQPLSSSTTLIDGVHVAISQDGGDADPVTVANALQPLTGPGS